MFLSTCVEYMYYTDLINSKYPPFSFCYGGSRLLFRENIIGTSSVEYIICTMGIPYGILVQVVIIILLEKHTGISRIRLFLPKKKVLFEIFIDVF